MIVYPLCTPPHLHHPSPPLLPSHHNLATPPKFWNWMKQNVWCVKFSAINLFACTSSDFKWLVFSTVLSGISPPQPPFFNLHELSLPSLLANPLPTIPSQSAAHPIVVPPPSFPLPPQHVYPPPPPRYANNAKVLKWLSLSRNLVAFSHSIMCNLHSTLETASIYSNPRICIYFSLPNRPQ